MKTAIIIAYTLIIVLAVVAFMQWRTIKKLTPAQSASGNPTKRTEGDGSALFGDMIGAVQKNIKDLEIKATF